MTLACVAVLATLQSSPTLVPTYLRTEYRVAPEGIDVLKPRLSWKLQAASKGLRNLKQTAYQVLVSTASNGLQEGKADGWDSGKTMSADSIHVEYGGKPLTADRAYWWKVRVWDQDGRASAWSSPAKWSMGLLQPEDWKAKWIGYDAAAQPDSGSSPNFRGAKWIWHPDDESGNAEQGIRSFTKSFEAPADIEKATLLVSADDQFELFLNDVGAAKSDGKTDAWKRPAEIDVTNSVRVGANSIRVVAENNGPGAAGLLVKLILRTKEGKDVVFASDKTWMASRESEAAKPAKELFNFGDGPWGWIGQRALVLPPPRFLRAEFQVPKPVRRAVLYGSAFGLADFHLNGKKVGDEYFTPGWTDYEKRVHYRAFDVTKSLRRGGNAVGAVLGDGWYAGYVGYGGRREHYGDKTRAIVQLTIEYTDGTRDVVASGDSWKALTGAIRESDFLMGETYDARRELVGWDLPGLDDFRWQRVDVGAASKGALEAFPGEPVRAYAVLKPKTITRPQPDDVYVLDLGQNMAGFARIRLQGKRGQKVTLRFAERLNPDGTIYTTNLRGARAIDSYTFRGKGVETWEPRFTFHGFQYIEVSGLGRAPKGNEVVGVAVSSDNPKAGTLETSDPMLNQLVRNAWWTQKMNFIDVPTDCPQRDERLGWTGDAQAYIRTASMSDDVQAFFTKWLVSLDDAQREDGQYPMVAPLKVAGADGGPGWADAGVICPWTIYDAYGDRRLLARHYPQMKKFIAFCVGRSTADLLPPEKFHCFGDWVSIGSSTPLDVIYEAYFAFSARLAAQAARALGLEAEAKEHEELYRRLKEAFNKAYVSADGTVKGDTQCAYVLALANDLLDGEVKRKAEAKLVDDIVKHNMRLTTGFLGTRDVMSVLSKIGRNDLAFHLLHSTEFPSWGFTIKNGATSIWERWDGWTPEKGFQDPGMNSFAHYAFGAVVGWMYDQLPGIRNTSPGFTTVRIAPQLDPKLTWCRGTYNSAQGPITSDWRIRGNELTLRVVVPPNVEGEVWVPASGAVRVVGMPELSSVRQEGKCQVFQVGSGEFVFEATNPVR